MNDRYRLCSAKRSGAEWMATIPQVDSQRAEEE
jgi:hypothetical protein